MWWLKSATNNATTTANSAPASHALSRSPACGKDRAFMTPSGCFVRGRSLESAANPVTQALHCMFHGFPQTTHHAPPGQHLAAVCGDRHSRQLGPRHEIG